MSEWVDDLITGYQKSSRDGTRIPVIRDYLQNLIIQNQRIIELLDSIDNLLRL